MVDTTGAGVVWHAVAKGKRAVVKTLVDECGADCLAPAKDGRAPCWVAAAMGQKLMVRLLVKELHADALSPNANGWTTVHVAAERGNESMVRLLVVDLQAPPDPPSNNGRTPLFAAAAGNHVGALFASYRSLTWLSSLCFCFALHILHMPARFSSLYTPPTFADRLTDRLSVCLTD